MNVLKSIPCLFFLIVPLALSAQSNALFTNAMVTYDDDVNLPSLQLIIDAEREVVEERWAEFWDERFNADVDRIDRDRNQETYMIEAVQLPSISPNQMDVYSQLTDSDERTRVSLAMRFGYDLPVTKIDYPQEYARAEQLMENFRVYFYEKFFDVQIAEIRDELEDVRDDREDAADDQSKAAKKIRKYQEKIKKLEERIADEREDLNDEEIVEMNKQDRIRELEEKLRILQQRRSDYVKG